MKRVIRPVILWHLIYRKIACRWCIYQTGDIVAFDIPKNSLPLVHERGWIPVHHRLLKRVVGGAGDQVCFRDNAVYIHQQFAGERRQTDSQGRPMPQLSGCITLTDNQVWVMLEDNPLSLDSRYLGAVDTATIYGKAVPVFTY